MIQAQDICLAFGSQIIFNNISFTLNATDRIGLVGRNGTGKTTLLKAINDPSFLDEGFISTQKNKKVAYMPQEIVLDSPLSIFEETLATFTKLYELIQEERELERLMKQNNDPVLIEYYAELQEMIARLGPDAIKAKTKKMLMGLGFKVQQLEQPVSELSVGWKMRVVLAKLLLQEADFYLFDEPTNHLDLVTKEWFLDFLKNASFGFIIICHERYFINELCTKVLELEHGKAHWYTGNYHAYEAQKDARLERLHAAYVQQQKEIKQKEATIARFRGSANKAKMAQSMQKALDRMERIVLPPSTKDIRFNFPPLQKSGKEVVRVENVAHAFDNKRLFKDITFTITRGQKVAIVAPNGAGKTTLFNLISEALPLQHGSISFGYNVEHAIFAQDQNQALNLDANLLENIQEICSDVPEQKIRTFLGAFLFSREDMLKKVGVLSGGEKNKVGMVGVLLQNANTLLLDEPTNHLDIQSKEILLKALQEFEGTLLFVSHDRDFINALATDVIVLTSRGAHHYHGNYDDYLYQKQAHITHKSKL